MKEPPAATSRTLPDLAAWRQKRGLSLEEIAQATKISPCYLRAIEEGCFDRLPGGIYDVSYLRQYARAVAFDEEELVSYYRQMTGQITENAPRPPRSGLTREGVRRPGSLLRGLI